MNCCQEYATIYKFSICREWCRQDGSGHPHFFKPFHSPNQATQRFHIIGRLCPWLPLLPLPVPHFQWLSLLSADPSPIHRPHLLLWALRNLLLRHDVLSTFFPRALNPEGSKGKEQAPQQPLQKANGLLHSLFLSDYLTKALAVKQKEYFINI